MQALNPATGEVLATVPRGGAADVDAAVAAARAAFEGPWSKFSPYERQCALLRIADLFETHWKNSVFPTRSTWACPSRAR
jgi:aldehyde dehydrogenase (NAD+)